MDISAVDRSANGQNLLTFPVHCLLAVLATLTAVMLLRSVEMGINDMRVPSAMVSLKDLADEALVPAPPSDFEREMLMTPRQLLDRWNPVIAAASKRFHIPQAWILAVMRRESGGRTMLDQTHKIASPAGALGLMQVMPGTYQEMADQYGLGADPLDPKDNIFAGAAYLSRLHRKYGYPNMFAAYNAGPGRLEQHLANGSVLPGETRAYVANVTRYVKSGAAARKTAVIRLTNSDGKPLAIDASQVTAVRSALEGEFPDQVKTVLSLADGGIQGVRENITLAMAAVKSAKVAL